MGNYETILAMLNLETFAGTRVRIIKCLEEEHNKMGFCLCKHIGHVAIPITPECWVKALVPDRSVLIATCSCGTNVVPYVGEIEICRTE